MTDTVNAPREPTLGMLEAAERVGSALAGSDASSGEISAAVWAAMLAAAPKAEPTPDSVDKVMAVLNYWFDGTARVRRDADMVKQLAALIDNAQPEAPKVEQEPVICHHEAYQGSCAHCGVKVVNGFAVRSKAHPAPASDELLEALETWTVEMTAKHGNPNGTDYEQGQNDMGVRVVSCLRSFRAKHKGPQS